MSLVDDIKALQANLIPDNTNNEISPKDVRDSLDLILDNLKDLGSNYYGAVTPASSAITGIKDGGTVLPLENGIYVNYNNLVVDSEFCIFKYSGGNWIKLTYHIKELYKSLDPTAISNPESLHVYFGHTQVDGEYRAWIKRNNGEVKYLLNEGEKILFERVDPATIPNPPNAKVFVGTWRVEGEYKLWVKRSDGSFKYGRLDGSNRELFERVDPATVPSPPNTFIFMGTWRVEGEYKLWIKRSSGEFYYIQNEFDKKQIDNVDFLLVTDTHVNKTDTKAGFRLYQDAVALMSSLRASFLLHGGDTINTIGDNVGYSAFENLSNRLGIPKYISLGNHDVNLDNSQDIIDFYNKVSDGYYGDEISYGVQPRLGYYHINVRGIDLFVLNNMQLDPDPGSRYIIDSTQEAWLQSELNALTGADKRVLVLSHVSLALNFGDPAFLNNQAQNARIQAMLKTWEDNNGIVLGVLNGHYHENLLISIDGVKYISFAAPVRDSAYSGDVNQLSFSHIRWDEANKIFKIIGYGRQDSYRFDYSAK